MSVFGGGFSPVLADGYQLVPQTRIRLTVVQWMPTKGVYEKWEALGGEFLISQTRTVSLPIIGTLPVGELDSTTLATEIAKRLKTRMGLVETPDATVEILEQPPIYVVGDVNKPGEYKFHPGLTVLQSLAMSGGEFRPLNGAQGSIDKTGYVGQLQEIGNSILRSKIRIVRLQAEMSGAKEMRFEQEAQDDSGLAAAIFQQEKVIHAARMNDMDRQSKSYAELRDLLTSEIAIIEKKIVSTDEDIESIRKELTNVKGMVERGIALPTRQSDLERTLRSYYGNRLDLVTAIMRARQNIAETTRNLDGLYDKQRTEVASELQSEQASLDQQTLKRATTQKLLLEALSGDTGSETRGGMMLAFTVTRQSGGSAREVSASDSTVLQPGDVVRVLRKVSPASPDTTELSAGQKTQSEQASQ
ncbi:polysaccharide biosynthesis/export family protein [Rhizobium herbae]|uniref:Polysaccharide export outer membrane protein n=1 Tax=Rhizobium herbae TaxID=508661 RepID=A0ABS4EWG4_9HYPH|nr:polysaccharide biosynthesis/export family protein [Rhizobium herbae]MBP1862289.1 polysaccharide export outer membrane protein [Rhizobium herbae]